MNSVHYRWARGWGNGRGCRHGTSRATSSARSSCSGEPGGGQRRAPRRGRAVRRLAREPRLVGKEVLGLLLLGVAVLALSVSPNAFLGLSLLVIGTDSLSEAHPLGLAGTRVYTLDVLLGIVLLRAFLPRERGRPPAALGEVTRLLFAVWALVMVAAGLRSALEGYGVVSVVRLATPLFYSFGFYFGLGRVIRERKFELDKAVRNLLLVALGLVAYMVFRALRTRRSRTRRTRQSATSEP